jgi:peptidoglycan/xylan/chitin deacetylase (PgdA/CDA1 family)
VRVKRTACAREIILLAAFVSAACTGSSETHAPPPPDASPAHEAPRAATAPPTPRAQIDGRAFPDHVLALTWDDGPDAHSLALATYLHAERVSATFFVVSDWVAGLSSDPGAGRGVFQTGYARIPILQELVRLGHRVGNHTLNHVLLNGVSARGARDQIRKNQDGIDAALVSSDLRLFRAPGGAWGAAADEAMASDPALRDLIGPIRWDIDRKDWDGSLSCTSAHPALECERAAPGNAMRVKPQVMASRYATAIDAAGHGIVLLHDRVGDVGSTYALDLARALVPELKARHYVFAAPVLAFSPLAPRAPRAIAAHAPVELHDIDGDGRAEACAMGDLNGDGRADACARSADGIVCALDDGRAFTRASTWLPRDRADARRWLEAQDVRFDLVDVNGDGRADLCVAADDAPERAPCGLAP